VLGFAWGVVATWWVGVFLGLALASASRLGAAPTLEWRADVPAVVRLSTAMAVSALALALALACGVVAIAHEGPVRGLDAIGVPVDRQHAFAIVQAAHAASYAVGLIGGFVRCVGTVRARRREGLRAIAEVAG